MKYLLVSIFYLISVESIYSQKHDNIWHLGYDWNLFTDYIEGNLAYFDMKGIHIEEFNESPVDFWCSNYTFCDSIGNMVYYTNGAVIVDKENKIVANSELVNDTLDWDLKFGNFTWNGHYGIQFETNKYLFIYSVDAGFRPLEIYIMEMSPDGGGLKVNYKDKLIVKDTFLFGNFQLCKHANGRDWWLVCPKADSNVFFTTLITPDTIYPPIKQAIGELRNSYDSGGQAKFSPDGEHYVFSSFICGVNLYDFDRTMGVFSNYRAYSFEVNHPFLEGARVSAVEFSPNSQYLYFANSVDMWQLDLNEAQDTIDPILIGTWDGFLDSALISYYPRETLFFHAQLAPDGKIYWVTLPNTIYMNVIEYPNRKGTTCFLNQRSVQFPNINSINMSTSPNYRLGPLDGSPADTLDIDNIPVANFRADQDTLDYLDFQFQDLSYYEPSTWSWDFGDGTTSSDTSPVHSYEKQGVYVVCLTVSNINGTSTICDTLVLGTNHTSSSASLKEILVFPNPASDQVKFIINDYYPVKASLRLMDSNGKQVLIKQVFHGWNDIDLEDLPIGMYYYDIADEGVRIYGGKLMVQ